MKVRREINIEVDYPVTLGQLRSILEHEHVVKLPDEWIFDYPYSTTFRITEAEEGDPPPMLEPRTPKDRLTLDSPIEDMDLSVRAYNVLKRESLDKVSDLVTRSAEDFFNLRNFGQRNLDEIVTKLGTSGFKIKS